MRQPESSSGQLSFIGHHLVYMSCTGCGRMERNACETADNARSVFCAYSCRSVLRKAVRDPSLLRKRLGPSSSSSVHTSNESPLITAHCQACLCLPAGAFVSHEWTLCYIYGIVISTVNRKCLWGNGRVCVWSVCVRAHANAAIPLHTRWCEHQRVAALLMQPGLCFPPIRWQWKGSSSPVAFVFVVP